MSNVAIKNPAGAIDDASKMTNLARDTHARLEEMFAAVDKKLMGVDGETKQAFMDSLKNFYSQASALEAKKNNLARTSVNILTQNVGNDQEFARKLAGIR
jgi:hypothetical protein